MKIYLGEFEELVLLTIAALGKDAYGVSIQRDIEERCNRTISIGALHSTIDLYRQAIAADASVAKKAYESIGDLYLNSFDACKKLKSHVDDRLVYLLAFDYYQKAGDARKMAVAKEGFPSKTEIFEENIKVGTSKNVECWGESTTIRTRD